MWLLAGLGNPGLSYAHHRHNAGFMAVDAIAREHGFSAESLKFGALVREGRIGTEKVFLLKPQSYMNLSGQSIGEFSRFYKIPLENIIVFHDELDLPLAKLRVKTGGGHGGHNGLKSIDAHIGGGAQRRLASDASAARMAAGGEAAERNQTFRVLAPDIAGRGLSDPLPDPALYNNAAYLADLLALLEALHVGECDWIGTSMGGILGMMMAAAQPGRIRKLVLNDVGAKIPASGLRRIAAYAGKRMKFSTREEAEAALRTIYAPFVLETEAQWRHLFTYSLKELPDGGTGMAYDPAITQGLLGTEIADIDLSALWEAVTCPVLVLRGHDSDILEAETAHAMAARPNVELLEFPGIGHAPSLMREEEIRLVAEWLA